MSNIENINLQNEHLQTVDLANLLNNYTVFDVILLAIGTAFFILFCSVVILIVLKIFTLTFSFMRFLFQKISASRKQNIERENRVRDAR